MIHRLSAELAAPASLLGGKARGLVELLRLGLPVPPAFVIDTAACRAFLRDGSLPDGIEAAARELAADTVSVRSGAEISMPGMMDTVLDLPVRELLPAVRAVFASWHTPRATTYRSLHGIPHDLGTAVIVQAMVHGERGGAGVAFSRDPSTGEPAPYGEMLFGRPGADVVSGTSVTAPLSDLASLEPAAWAELRAALDRLERHYRDVCHVEFTVDAGRLWFLQVRPGGLAGAAAVRVAVDLADEQIIDRRTAVDRISPRDLAAARLPRIRHGDLLTRGQGASPGVATGRIAVDADRAVRMAVDGPVLLVRPHTSPLDLHGMAAAVGILTSRGGPTSHAAVVARAMRKPAVVAATGLTVEAAEVRAGARVLPEGTLITIDGTGGEVALGDPGSTTEAAGPHLSRLLDWQRRETCLDGGEQAVGAADDHLE
ncbi:MAG: PEP/pyruvate-binding domain-containing protein [Actinoplanes sp.]